MMAYEHLLTRILPQTLPCPRSMALDALQMIAMDFFRESGAWLENINAMCCGNDQFITPDLPRDAALVNVHELSLEGRKLEKSEYRLEGDGIVLTEAPQCVCCLYGLMSLRPKRTALEMPEDLLEEYGDSLIYGALARLKAMSGNRVEWSDPKGAELNYSLYQEGLARTRQRKYRKRFGGQLLYAQTAEME